MPARRAGTHLAAVHVQVSLTTGEAHAATIDIEKPRYFAAGRQWKSASRGNGSTRHAPHGRCSPRERSYGTRHFASRHGPHRCTPRERRRQSEDGAHRAPESDGRQSPRPRRRCADDAYRAHLGIGPRTADGRRSDTTVSGVCSRTSCEARSDCERTPVARSEPPAGHDDASIAHQPHQWHSIPAAVASRNCRRIPPIANQTSGNSTGRCRRAVRFLCAAGMA